MIVLSCCSNCLNDFQTLSDDLESPVASCAEKKMSSLCVWLTNEVFPQDAPNEEIMTTCYKFEGYGIYDVNKLSLLRLTLENLNKICTDGRIAQNILTALKNYNTDENLRQYYAIVDANDMNMSVDSVHSSSDIERNMSDITMDLCQKAPYENYDNEVVVESAFKRGGDNDIIPTTVYTQTNEKTPEQVSSLNVIASYAFSVIYVSIQFR